MVHLRYHCTRMQAFTDVIITHQNVSYLVSSNGIYTGRIPQKALQISTQLLSRDNIWAILIMLQSATSEVLSALLDIFELILKNFLLNQRKKRKNEIVSVTTHNDVYWTCAIRDENRVRTGNNREHLNIKEGFLFSSRAGFSCSDFRRKHAEFCGMDLNMSKCIKWIWAYDTIIGGWKKTNISLKIKSLINTKAVFFKELLQKKAFKQVQLMCFHWIDLFAAWFWQLVLMTTVSTFDPWVIINRLRLRLKS